MSTNLEETLEENGILRGCVITLKISLLSLFQKCDLLALLRKSLIQLGRKASSLPYAWKGGTQTQNVLHICTNTKFPSNSKAKAYCLEKKKRVKLSSWDATDSISINSISAFLDIRHKFCLLIYTVYYLCSTSNCFPIVSSILELLKKKIIF